MYRGFWKRVLVIAMICGLLVSGMASAELFEKDSSVVSFDLALMTAVGDVNAEEWMSDEETRGMVSFLLALDLHLETKLDISVIDVERPTYLGRNGTELVCYVPGSSGEGIVIFYEEFSEQAGYKLVGDISSAEVEAAMSEVCPDGFYSNTPEIMGEIAVGLYNALDSASEE